MDTERDYSSPCMGLHPEEVSADNYIDLDADDEQDDDDDDHKPAALAFDYSYLHACDNNNQLARPPSMHTSAASSPQPTTDSAVIELTSDSDTDDAHSDRGAFIKTEAVAFDYSYLTACVDVAHQLTRPQSACSLRPTTGSTVIELTSGSDTDHANPDRPAYDPDTGGIRFCCAHDHCAARRPVSKLRHLHAHWQSAHCRRPDGATSPSAVRFGLDWAVFCYKCKRSVTLGGLQRHQDEQHTGEIFAVVELHDRMCCALCGLRAPRRDVLFEHFWWSHQQTEATAEVSLPEMRHWLTDRRLERVCGTDPAAAAFVYGCSGCDWQVAAGEDERAAGAEVVDHVWKEHLEGAASGSNDTVLRLLPFDNIRVHFANGLTLTHSDLANTCRTAGLSLAVSQLSLRSSNVADSDLPQPIDSPDDPQSLGISQAPDDLSQPIDSSDDLQLLETPAGPPILLSDNDADDHPMRPAGDAVCVDRKPVPGDLLAAMHPMNLVDLSAAADDAAVDLRFQCLFCVAHFADLSAAYEHWSDEHRSAQTGTFFYGCDRLVRCSRCFAEFLLRQMPAHIRSEHKSDADIVALRHSRSACAICEQPVATGVRPCECLRPIAGSGDIAAVCLTGPLLVLLQAHGYGGRLHCLNCRSSAHDAATFQRHHQSNHRQMMPLYERRPDGARLWCPLCRHSTRADEMSAMLEHCHGRHMRRFGCLVCEPGDVRSPNWFGSVAAVRKHHARAHGLCGERGWRRATDWHSSSSSSSAGALVRGVLVSLPAGLVVTWAEVAGREECLGGGVLAGWSVERAARELERLDAECLQRSLDGKQTVGGGGRNGRQKRRPYDSLNVGGLKMRMRMRRDCAVNGVELEESDERARSDESAVEEVEGVGVGDGRSAAAVPVRAPGRRRAQIVKCRWCRVIVRAPTTERCRRTLEVHGRLNHADRFAAARVEDEVEQMDTADVAGRRDDGEGDGTVAMNCTRFDALVDLAPVLRA